MTEPMTPTSLFKYLADDTRTKITLLIVSEGELCVCELTVALEQSQPKISRHLALLRSAGLLIDRRQGQWVYYRLNPELPAWVTAILTSVLDANQQWLTAESTRLYVMNGRPINQAVFN
ncbi:metalloregulator ArsR/SmtB family transcription factor [Pseudomonas sp. A2]|uniref:metalloregulator ArsR/SmtB family transcription factor n=1 Tax=Pseudomonas sp. A2 TaxID=107445 RepID=UPI002CEFFF7A|nr:metalloregulator ArsR/SmtB family transcription factor [Pseudomonas sp. A2]MEB3438064.1 metalloregulator ArsR/SmtB family transcription factor [Pseudomonas sp. A2]